MTTDNKDNKLSIGSSDYAEILRHAVAVIEHVRTEIARHINGYVSTAYWEIGQMLHERKIERGYGDSVVKRLSVDLNIINAIWTITSVSTSFSPTYRL